MLKIAEIAHITGSMIETPYRLGVMAPGKGFDCLSYMVWFYRELGVKLPGKFRQYTIDNYAAEYQKDPAGAKKALYWFLRRFGEKVENPAFMQPGDLCLIRGGYDKPDGAGCAGRDDDIPDRNLVSAIYVGAGNLMTCDARAGIVVIPKHKLATEIAEVRRPCHRLHR